MGLMGGDNDKNNDAGGNESAGPAGLDPLVSCKRCVFHHNHYRKPSQKSRGDKRSPPRLGVVRVKKWDTNEEKTTTESMSMYDTSTTLGTRVNDKNFREQCITTLYKCTQRLGK